MTFKHSIDLINKKRKKGSEVVTMNLFKLNLHLTDFVRYSLKIYVRLATE